MQEKSSTACDEFLAALGEVVQRLGEEGSEGLARSGSSVEGAKAESGAGMECVPGTLAAALSTIKDPRREHLRVYSLVSLLQVAVAAMLAGKKSVSAIG